VPLFVFCSDMFSIKVMGTEAGAVIYHICFPCRFDFLNNCDAFGSPSTGTISNPAGGLYGAGATNETVLVVESFGGLLDAG